MSLEWHKKNNVLSIDMQVYFPHDTNRTPADYVDSDIYQIQMTLSHKLTMYSYMVLK